MHKSFLHSLFFRAGRVLFPVLLFSLSACAPARPPVPPGTIPQAKEPTVSDEQYGHDVLQALSEKYKIDYNNPEVDRIQSIVDRLAKAAHADQQPWHVYLFKDDKLKNAAATRGNHIFIWTGMLLATKSDGELATVLAHEMGHVLAGHTAGDPNEEIKRILIQVAGMAAGFAVSATSRIPVDLSGVTQSVTQGVGEGLFLNPYARGDEYEADQIGLELMAEAKFDPQDALKFWERVSGDPDFSAGISFLSTHPPAPERLAKLKQLLPYAEARYKGAPAPTGTQLASNSDKPNDNTPVEHVPVRPSKRGWRHSTPTPTLQPPSSTPSAPPVDTISASDPAANSGPRTSGGDSFDLRDKIPDARGGEQPWADSWKVIDDRAVLYEEASSQSKKIGEFRRGAVVQSTGRKNGWLRITHPDHGFLHETSLMPIYGARPK